MNTATPLHLGDHAQESLSLEGTAALCKAAGDDLRLHILRVLRQDAYGVLELCRIFDMRQPAMSHHLKVLTRAGLVNWRREGTHLFYHREQAIQALQQSLLDTVDSCPIHPLLAKQINEVQQTRAAISGDFFRQNADKFREQQDLIASYPQYGTTLVDLLDDLVARGAKTVLEVGPGEGEFLSDLHPRFGKVIALDNSAEMLARSRAFAREQKLSGIQFIHGDTRDAVKQQLKADAVTLNMVLHHTPSPASVIIDLAKILNPGGVLLVTELCQHDQDWARSACGDLWLGFDPEELTGWANAAGLAEGEALYLALRNGFRIQVRQFTLSTPATTND